MDDVKLCSTAFIRHTFTVCRFVIHTPVYPVAEIAAELLRFCIRYTASTNSSY